MQLVIFKCTFGLKEENRGTLFQGRSTLFVSQGKGGRGGF